MGYSINKGFTGSTFDALKPQAWYANDGFEASTVSRDRSYIQTPVTESMVNPSEFTRHEITRMSRYLINNYPLAERIASLCEIYGIGAGISANSSTKDAAFNLAATDLFSQWADSSLCTSDHELNFYEAQRVIARELLICGEVFIVLQNTDKGFPQLMLVKSEQVRNSGVKDDDSLEGIYFDDYGKATAYNVDTGRGFEKFDSSNVIHLKRVKNIGQKRGVGMFASSLNAMRDHKDMHILIKKAMKTHLALAVHVKKNHLGAEGGGIADGLFRVDANSIPTTAPTNKGLERVFGGQVIYGQEGDEIELLASEHPGPNIVEFLEQIMRDVCMSVSLPYEFVVNADKLTGTGVRFAITDAAFFFQTLQNVIIDGALNRIWYYVCSVFIKYNKLAPPANQELPSSVGYTRPCSLTVDQGRMNLADIASLQAGLTNREIYYSARGRDWKKEADQWFAEMVYLKEQAEKLGIPLALVLQMKQGAPSLPEPVDKQQGESSYAS